MALIQCAEKSEFSCFSQIICAEDSSFVFSDEIICGENSEFKVISELVCSDNSEFFMFSAAVYDTLTFHTAVEDTAYEQYIAPFVFPTLTLKGAGAGDYSKYITNISVSKTLGGKTYADITMVEPDGASEFMDNILALQAQFINPLYSGLCDSPFSSPFQTAFPNPLNPNNFINSVKAYFVLKIAVGYTEFQEFTYTNMVPTVWSFDGTEFNIKIEDFTVLLEQEGQSMTPDINADAGVIRSAQATIKEICTKYGIPNVVFNGFNDFIIRLLRRTEDKPLNWVDMICRVTQAKRSWVGNTLTFGPTKTADELSPKWSLVEGNHIIEGSFDVSLDLSDYRNKFKISRTSPNGGIIGEQECIGFSCPGRTGNITFDTPVNYASAVYEVTNGDLQDFVYENAIGVPVYDSIEAGPSGVFIQSATPVSGVKFTYKANIGNQVQGNALGGSNSGIGGSGAGYGQQINLFQYTPRYKVTYFGKKNGSTGIDTEYKFTVIDNDGVACLGLRPEYSNIEDSIIPSAGVAQRYATAVLKEATRKVLKAKLETPFVNPFIEPGDCIAITDYELKFTNVKWIVEEVIVKVDGDESTMTLNLSRGKL